VAEHTKVIIWCCFVPELKYVYEQLKADYRCCLYYGATSQYERDRIKKAFVQGEYDIFIGNCATAGMGLNLQNIAPDGSTVQYFYSNSFKTEDRLQAEDRSHRDGMVGTVVYKDVVARRTIDQRLWENITSGRDMNDYFKRVSVRELLTDEADE
jgi:superfamily II DNA/RNA helicase